MINTNTQYNLIISNYLKNDSPRKEYCNALFKFIFNKIKIKGTTEFAGKIKKMISKLIETKPGAELFTRILRANQPIIIQSDSNNGFVYANKTVLFNINQTVYVHSKNSKDELILVKRPIKMGLAHELIHAMHYVENPHATFLRSKHSNKTTTSEEEHLTIMGTSATSPSDLCCENSFHAAFKRPFRATHFGVSSLLPLSLADFVTAEAIGDIKEQLDRDPDLINKSCSVHFLPHTKITPLTAACCKGNRALVNFLFQRGADINAQDDIGGAFIAAIRAYEYYLAFALFNLGINVHLKDAQGRTALDILQAQHFLDPYKDALIFNLMN